MEWVIPLAIVAATAWAVRWQFRDVERPPQPALRVVGIEEQRTKKEGQPIADPSSFKGVPASTYFPVRSLSQYRRR